MTKKEKIAILAQWGKLIQADEGLQDVFQLTEQHNRWLTVANCQQAVDAICQQFLDSAALENWLVDLDESEALRKVALILAGNIPLVGFHDLLAVLASGNQAVVRVSSKEKYLLPYLVKILAKVDQDFAGRIQFEERMLEFDAVIATGSNNSARYFEQYFGKYPNIIRKNRTSAAVLTGQEGPADLQALAKDIFNYYGLGCRNVSKLFLPAGYDPAQLLSTWENWSELKRHAKYQNNFDYNLTLLILNKTDYLASEFLMLVESQELVSPVATLYYEFYDSEKQLDDRLKAIDDGLQCTVGAGPSYLDFGIAQQPGLADYADRVNTLEFLRKL